MWLEKNQEALMVVVALVANIALQAGINQPGGILTTKYFEGEQYHEPDTSLLAMADPVAYMCFFPHPAATLQGSLTMILLTVSGLPLNPRASLWVRRIITWVSITALAIMDGISKGAFTPISRDGMDPVLLMVIYSIVAWCAIMSLVLLAVFVRVIGRLVIRMKMRG